MNTPQREDIFRQLQSAFDALALLFLQPEDEAAGAALAAAAEAVDRAGRGFLNEARLDRLHCVASREVDPLELSRAYARLFLGVGETTIPLCESAWTSPQHLLCQSAQLECRKAYAEAGLGLSGGPAVPEDHLGLMLAFLSVAALRNDAAAGLAFFDAHLAPFSKGLVRAVKGENPGPYVDVVEVLEAAVALLAVRSFGGVSV